MTNFRPGGFQVLPTVVKNIIIINVIMVFIQFAMGRSGIIIADYLGLHYWASPKFRWWQLFTHLFMHGDAYDIHTTFWHLFSNMFALWMFGRILENMWGPKRFLIFYFVCGLGAAFCHIGVLTYEFTNFYAGFLKFQQNPNVNEYTLFIKHHNLLGDPLFNKLMVFWQSNANSTEYAQIALNKLHEYYSSMIDTATVGASGAVFGVLFAFGYLFPNAELMLIFPPIPVKAKWVVGAYALFELWSGVQNSAGDNVAHFAHIGGMIFAFILLKFWNTRKRADFY